MRTHVTVLLVGLLLVGVPLAGCIGEPAPGDGGDDGADGGDGTGAGDGNGDGDGTGDGDGNGDGGDGDGDGDGGDGDGNGDGGDGGDGNGTGDGDGDGGDGDEVPEPEPRNATASWEALVSVRVAGTVDLPAMYGASVDFTVDSGDTSVLVEVNHSAELRLGSDLFVHICPVDAECGPDTANATVSGSAPIRQALAVSELGPGNYTAVVSIEDTDLVVMGAGQLGVTVFPTMQPPDDYTAFA